MFDKIKNTHTLSNTILKEKADLYKTIPFVIFFIMSIVIGDVHVIQGVQREITFYELFYVCNLIAIFQIIRLLAFIFCINRFVIWGVNVSLQFCRLVWDDLKDER